MVVLNTVQLDDAQSVLPLDVPSTPAASPDFGVALETELDNSIRQHLPTNHDDEEKSSPETDPAAISPLTLPIPVPFLAISLPVSSTCANETPESRKGISQGPPMHAVANPLQPETLQIAFAEPVDDPSASDQQPIELTPLPSESKLPIDLERPEKSSAVPLPRAVFAKGRPAAEERSEAAVADIPKPPMQSPASIDTSVVNEKSGLTSSWVLVSQEESKSGQPAADRSHKPAVAGFNAHMEGQDTVDQRGKLEAPSAFQNGSSPHQEKEQKPESHPILIPAFPPVVPDQPAVSTEQFTSALAAPLLHARTTPPSAAFMFDSETGSGRSTEVWTAADKAAVMSQVVEKAQLMVKENNSEIVVSLKPEFLGRITLRAAVVDQTLVTTIVTESPGVKELLQSDLPTLHNLLQEAGVNSARVIVTRESDLNFAGSSSGPLHTEQHTPSFSHQHHGSTFRWPDERAWSVFQQREAPPEIAGTSPAFDNRYSSRSIHLIA
jgi:flagellar hook-length control protein FliK